MVFTRKPDAIAAVKRYNNVQLDQKPMKIELIGTNLNSGLPLAVARATNGALANSGRGRMVVVQLYVFLPGLSLRVWSSCLVSSRPEQFDKYVIVVGL